MKKLFLSMMLMALPILASAYDCQVDGIYYNLVPKAGLAEVTYGDTKYSGSITIPEKFTYDDIEYTVTCIGATAFSGCSDLASVAVPNSVISIENSAFYNCINLTSVNIPTSVTVIKNSAFSNCSALTFIDIPNGVTTIGDCAFWGCSGLTSVSIPSSVTYIGGSAFTSCIGLNSVHIMDLEAWYKITFGSLSSNPLSNAHHLYLNGEEIRNIVIPNSVTNIGNYTFSGCSNLASVTIPNSVTSIGEEAFSGCSGLTSVTIGSSVRTISGKAFAECSKLEEVYCLSEQVPETNTDAFEKSYPEYTTLYVPAASLNDYKTTEPWSLFGTIKAISGTGEEPTKCATPTISYGGKRLTFSCETEGVEYVYEITDADIKKGYDAEVDLTATYEISVYATKSGYTNSDVATATLVWTDAIFTETTPETPTSAKAVKESIPVLISAKGGNISVKCEADGQEVNVYTIDGLSLGSATVKNGEALISTSIQSGDIAVVKVGGRSVKVIMR